MNTLSNAERAHLLAVLNSPRFVDRPLLQMNAQLLDENAFPFSVSTMHRVLREDTQVKDRRREATHRPRAVPLAVPELVAT